MLTTTLWTVADGLIIGDETGNVSLVPYDYYEDKPAWTTEGQEDTWQVETKMALPVVMVTTGVIAMEQEDGSTERVEMRRIVLSHNWVVEVGYLPKARIWCRRGEPVQKQDKRAFIEGR